MDAFIRLPAADRRRLCEEAQARRGMHAVAIEKDFWVCWTLRELFQLPDWGERLTFKGGTSLSKAWQLIERFSEDIDIVIDRDFLGFGGDGGPERAATRGQQRRRLVALRAACRQRINESLRPALAERFQALLPADAAWTLKDDEHDPDQQSLMFEYPSVIGGAYVRPVVKIELGARSDTEPCERPTIEPYLAGTFPSILGPSAFALRTVAPRRTFWEKAMLLHEETYRPADKLRKPRLARHYYDVWALIDKGVAAGAVADPGLFERIAAHREIFFRWTWMDYATLRRGSLRIAPLEDQLPGWRQDYSKMKEEMFFGDPPSFDEVLRVVREFEVTFNAGAAEGV